MRLASGWSPAVTSSPLITTMFRTPRAAAPRRSACSASRLRSRTVSCMIGSMPRSTSRCAAAIAERWTWAPVLSVQLMASTTPRSMSPLRSTAMGSALSLEVSSAVTTNWPSRSNSARWLVPTRLPALGRYGVPSVHEVDPRRRPLQLPVDRLLQMLDVVSPQRHPPGAFPGLDPDTALIGKDLAVAVGSNAPARAIAKVLGTAHRTAEPGGMQDA